MSGGLYFAMAVGAIGLGIAVWAWRSWAAAGLAVAVLALANLRQDSTIADLRARIDALEHTKPAPAAEAGK